LGAMDVPGMNRELGAKNLIKQDERIES
jgi:hypothetical protein